jgi:hypothetical protein
MENIFVKTQDLYFDNLELQIELELKICLVDDNFMTPTPKDERRNTTLELN